MFNCASSKVKSNIVFEMVLTEGQKLSQELALHKRNQRLQFLILLRDEDFQKCIFSYRDMIAYRKNNFPGNLIIERFEDCEQLPYRIKEPVMPRQLYIMLPKEKFFIPSDVFTESYIRSKMRELIQIFVKLNAKSVKFSYSDMANQHQSMKLHSALRLPNTNVVEISEEFKNEEKSTISTKYEMKFRENEEMFRIEDFLNSDNYYYLKQEDSWQYMIQRRIDYRMTYDKYTYQNSERKLLKNKFVTKLKMIDLTADYDWEKFKEFQMNYEIEYYPQLTLSENRYC